ncbi:hypothetical protein [Sphingobacterium faecale]|uniref:Phage abortive infection protein n=1 Tax=Sphingobacterium faecale TaxID=2803775 RepID=A0ABS1R4R5_9SPHI|nr:hypothetical protein [Sphingobacterium faecale]MBL1408821.1 hypothetical protein [Sphingobacterium faecale]
MIRLIWRKLEPYLLGILILFVFSLPFIGVKIYNYWAEFIPDKDGYNGISATVAYIGGILNIITIIFLYVNYREQKRQNEDQQQDTDFNRAIDLVYKQLEHTLKLKDQFLEGDNRPLYYNLIHNKAKPEHLGHSPVEYFKSKGVDEIFSYYIGEFDIYNSILVSVKDRIKRKKLSQIIFRNISIHLHENFSLFLKAYEGVDLTTDEEHQKLFKQLTSLVNFYDQK